VPNKNTTTDSNIATWQRERSSDELLSFLSSHTDKLGAIDDDDFELAAI
jgi:hypothetical protein